MQSDTIKTFLVTAELLSFSKAGQSLYLTPNAIKKRIEAFERELGFELFLRTNRGVQLTKAGEALYQDLLLLEKQYKTAVSYAKDIANDETSRLHIGISDTFSDIFLSSNWINTNQKKRSTHLIRYGNTVSDLEKMFSDIGHETDVVIDLCDQKTAGSYDLKMIQTSEYPAYIGLPFVIEDQEKRNNWIASSTIDVLYKGRSTVTDQMIEYIAAQYPNATIREIDNYHFWTIQESLEKGNCIFVAGDLKRLYPHYHFYKTDFDQKVSFGIYYKNESEAIRSFIDMIQER